MIKKFVIVGIILLATGVAFFGTSRSGVLDGDRLEAGERTVLREDIIDDNIQNILQEVEWKIETVAEDLFVPWSIVFTSSDRILFTERDGKIREIKNYKLNPNPLIVFPDISSKAEEGLMGLTLDPDYGSNAYLYACYAYEKNGKLADRVARLIDNGANITEDKAIIDNIPAAKFHAGCRIIFGPDGKLYVTTGDATDKKIAQDPNSLGGKILRINKDGSIPKDNPFSNSPVYSLGHRNSQGLDWHPVSKSLYSTEHGPSGFDGPGGGDEVNIIISGGNYGWPVVSHEKSKEGFIDPKLVFTPAEAPASGMFYKSGVIPQFKNNFFFGALKGEGIIRIIFSEEDPKEVISFEKLDIGVGRIREVAEGPDGLIYFSTSNRDGRGDLNPNDDKIYRIIPSGERL